MIRPLALLITGTASVGVSTAEAAIVLRDQILSDATPISTVQLGFLVTGIGLLLLAGRMYGKFEQGQKQILQTLEKRGKDIGELFGHINRHEGILIELRTRTGVGSEGERKDVG